MFSEVVDNVVERAKRTDQLANAASYVRSVIRECQLLRFFSKDLIEDTLTANASPYIWTRSRDVRRIRTVYYPSVEEFVKMRPPGARQDGEDYYYYAAADYIAFAGVSSGDEIDIAYYRYLPPLEYFSAALRPAAYNYSLDTYTYLPAYDNNDTEREAARNLTGNWLLRDWREMIEEGALAMLFKQIGDQRTITHFSAYRSARDLFMASEAFEGMNL